MLPTEDLAGQTIVVTGATGVIGRALLPRLIEAGVRPRTTSTRLPAGDFPAEAEHHLGDLTDICFAEKLMRGADGLIHLAGRRGSVGIQTTQAATMLGENARICLTTLEAARRAAVARMVYVSTVSVYPPMALYKEELAWSANPHEADQYAAWAKRIAEKQIEAMEIQYGLRNIAIVRPVNTFGPFDDFNPATALVVPALIARAVAGEDPFTVWGDGTAVRDFLFASDVADGILLAYRRGLGRGPINLGSGKGYAIRELVEIVLHAVGHAPRVTWNTDRPSGESVKVADISKARSVIGFEPRVSLAEGIARTVAWYRESLQRPAAGLRR